MTTTERELDAPVDLCTPDGRRLNPDAIGWSRQPLHTGNLRGSWGRNKRWDYWAVLGTDVVVSITYADIDYAGLVAVWWADLTDGRSGGREVTVPLGRGVHLPDRPGSAPLRFSANNLEVEILDETSATTLRATWTERDRRRGRLQIRVDRPTALDSMNVVIPWSDRRFQYTSKQQARPASGELVVGQDRWQLGGEQQPAWGVLDVGRGRWPYQTRWNWGGGAGHTPDGTTVGLQIGGKWTEGTGHTENAVIVDGVAVKLGDELQWNYDWDDPLQPWEVRSSDGSLDLQLTPRFDRHAATKLGIISTEVHQVFGAWNGTIPDPHGEQRTVQDLVGFAEESRSRW